MEKTGFLDAAPGNKSNSRLISIVTIFGALFLASFIVIAGFFGSDEPDLINLGMAAGVIFVTIAGPAMAFSFGQKLSEIKNGKQKPE